MSKIQLVIEIDEENYEKNQYGRCPVTVMRKAIRNGTPLPKGHGRLIDADDIDYIADFMGNWTSEERIKNTSPTIIEADGGGEDEISD